MTITNTILRNDYTGNGVATVFNFTFIVLNETGGYTIQVITTDLSGIETIKTQNVDYTVQLNDNGLGTITFTTAPLLNHKITLLSNVLNTQETDYIKAGTDKFPAESHEKALDKLTLICKQFAERFNRIVSLPKNSTLSNIEFPINNSNANQILAINNEGTNLTTKNLADVGLAPVSSYIKTLLDDINSSQARATLEAQQLNNNLSALASLIGSSNKIPYFTGAGAMALTDTVSPASTTTQGIIQIATNAEVLAGSVANKAIVPSAFTSLFSTASLLTSGSSSFASLVKDTASNTIKVGITKCKLQSTTLPAGGEGVSITFDSAFPTTCVGVFITPVTWSGANPQIAVTFITSITPANFIASNTDGDTNITSFFYIAIGY